MKSLFALGSLALSLALIGCGPKAEEPQTDVNAAMKQSGKDAGVKTSPGEKAAEPTGKMAGAAGEAGGKMAGTVGDFASDSAILTGVVPKIKDAIKADSVLSAPENAIDVDVKEKVIHLKGSVANNDAKRKLYDVISALMKTLNAPADIKISNEVAVQKR